MKLFRVLMTVIVVMSLLGLFAACGKGGDAAATGSKDADTTTTTTSSSEKYGVKSGIIEYEFGMKSMAMKKIFYFDDFGKKECIEMFYDGQMTELQIAKDGVRTTMRPQDAKKVAWQANNAYGIGTKINPSMVKGQKGVTMLPNMTVAGKECDAYAVKTSGLDTVFAGYKGVQMLFESKGKMETFDRATKAEFDVAVPAGKFEIPAGYEIKKQ